jgi:hypothetical protein
VPLVDDDALYLCLPPCHQHQAGSHLNPADHQTLVGRGDKCSVSFVRLEALEASAENLLCSWIAKLSGERGHGSSVIYMGQS